MQPSEPSGVEFWKFLKNNVSSLGKILGDHEAKLSVADFATLHTIFMNIDAAIISAVDVFLSDPSNRDASLQKFRETMLSNKKELDEYYVNVLMNHLESNDVTRK